MTYLLDTNVISELVKLRPNQKVVSWVNSITESELFLSSITIGELTKGIQKITDKKNKMELQLWLDQELIERFKKRILPIDILVAERWGKLLANAKKTLPAIDSLLAATALQHSLCMVTRNVSDFQIPALDVYNPWE